MLSTLLVFFLTATAASEPLPADPPSELKTLWIMRSLYPGQQFLVSRSEEVMQGLLKQVEGQVVGSKALSQHLQTHPAQLDCLVGQKKCGNPIDAFVAGLGFDRVVMLKGAQEDSLYRFQVTSYLPGSGEVAHAEGTGASLKKALIGSLVKVVPLTSLLKVSSKPVGATVFIDGEKVGKTPYSGQVLPGERLLKLDAPSHMPVERKFEAPVRGNLEFSENLEKVPARLVIMAAPKGVSIELDGKNLGKDKVDMPIQPGTHRVSLTLEGHQPFSDAINIVEGTTFTLEKKLSPTAWNSFRQTMHQAQEEVYAYRSYFRLNFEHGTMVGSNLYAQKDISKKYDDDSTILAESLLEGSPRTMNGFSVEYGQTGRHFGAMVVGGAYYKSSRPWRYSLTHNSSKTTEGTAKAEALVLRGMQPNIRIALWRLVFTGQLGLEVRALVLREQTSVWLLDAQLSAQAMLQAFIYKGFHANAAYRYCLSPFSSNHHAEFRDFQVGAGYAF